MRKFVIGLLLLVAVAGAISWLGIHEDELPEGLIQASGRIEGDEISIAADVSGRIDELTAQEGGFVEADQLLARLDGRAGRARGVQPDKALVSGCWSPRSAATWPRWVFCRCWSS